MANWMMVTSEENFEQTLKHSTLGFYGNKTGVAMLKKISVGDKIIFYITRQKIVRGLFEVSAPPHVDDSPLYGGERDSQWNQRIPLKCLDSTSTFDFRMLVYDMEFVKDKGTSYGGYLACTLVSLNDSDFATMIDAMRIDAKGRPVAVS